MKLIDALKNFTVFNLDTDEEIFGCVYCEGEDNSHYDMFIHNLKELSSDEEEFNKLCNIEMTPEFLNKLKKDDTDDILDDNINYTILAAAWLTYNGYDYEECKINDSYDDLYEDCYNYKFSFNSLNFSYDYECDVDLT